MPSRQFLRIAGFRRTAESRINTQFAPFYRRLTPFGRPDSMTRLVSGPLAKGLRRFDPLLFARRAGNVPAFVTGFFQGNR